MTTPPVTISRQGVVLSEILFTIRDIRRNRALISLLTQTIRNILHHQCRSRLHLLSAREPAFSRGIFHALCCPCVSQKIFHFTYSFHSISKILLISNYFFLTNGYFISSLINSAYAFTFRNVFPIISRSRYARMASISKSA